MPTGAGIGAGSGMPNDAHLALARWSLRRPGMWLVTQNVDGLHTAVLDRVPA